MIESDRTQAYKYLCQLSHNKPQKLVELCMRLIDENYLLNKIRLNWEYEWKLKFGEGEKIKDENV